MYISTVWCFLSGLLFLSVFGLKSWSAGVGLYILLSSKARILIALWQLDVEFPRHLISSSRFNYDVQYFYFYL